MLRFTCHCLFILCTLSSLYSTNHELLSHVIMTRLVFNFVIESYSKWHSLICTLYTSWYDHFVIKVRLIYYYLWFWHWVLFKMALIEMHYIICVQVMIFSTIILSLKRDLLLLFLCVAFNLDKLTVNHNISTQCITSTRDNTKPHSYVVGVSIMAILLSQIYHLQCVAPILRVFGSA